MRAHTLALALAVGCSFPTAEFGFGSADATTPIDSMVTDMALELNAPEVPQDTRPTDVPQDISVLRDVPMVTDVPMDIDVPMATDVPVASDLPVTPDSADGATAACDPLGRPACPAGTVCTDYYCSTQCAPGESPCAGACRNLRTDDMNCGACGVLCGTTGVCHNGGCVPRVGNFRVTSLGASGCTVVEHGSVTGNPQGAIAVSQSSVFISGTGASTGPASITARFNSLDLSDPQPVAGRAYEALVTNLRDGAVYTFGAGSSPLGPGGGTASRLLELNPTTGALSTRFIPLSGAVNMSGSMTSQVGIFSGYDRVVLIAGSRVINITLPGGNVSDIGSSAPLTHSACPSWAFWGLAESVGTEVSLVYVQNSSTIARTHIGSVSRTSVLVTVEGLSTMCGIGASIARNRWYFQVSGRSRFGDGAQTLGFCRASFER